MHYPLFSSFVIGLMSCCSLQAIQTDTSEFDSSICSKEYLMSFFPIPIVKSILIQHEITGNQLEDIVEYLAEQDQKIVQTVEKKAAEMDPNPLTDFNHREMAVELFKETLNAVFIKALENEGIEINGEKAKVMLDEIQKQKGKLFHQCIKQSQGRKLVDRS